MSSEQDLTVNDADKALFGVSGQRIPIIEQMDIMSIDFNLSQPRRLIRASIRQAWPGDALLVGEMIDRWVEAAQDEYGSDINMFMLMGGNTELHNYDDLPLVDGLARLVNLARSIERRGLINNITVARSSADGYVVETGERRLMAHHLLVKYRHDKFGVIKAEIVDQSDVWRMATENFDRQDLNAISVARQLGVLLMDLCKDVDGVDFGTYQDMALDTFCDRAYFAQAANGDVHRLRKGQAELVANAIGKSVAQMRQYRSLLRIPDEMWMVADDGNWTEGFIRSELERERQDSVTNVTLEDDERQKQTRGKAPHDVAWDDLKEAARLRNEAEDITENEGIVSPVRMIMAGDRVTTKDGFPGLVETTSFDRKWADVLIDGDRGATTLSIESLTLVDAVDTHKPIDDQGIDIDGVHYSDDLDLIEKTLAKSEGADSPDIQAGDRVMTPKGEGTVTSSMKSIKGNGKLAHWIQTDDGHTFICQGDDISSVLPAISDHELIDDEPEPEISEIIYQFSGGDRVVTNDGHGRFWKQLDETQCGIQLDGENIDVIGYELANIMLESEWPGMEIGDRVQHGNSGHVVVVKSFEIGHPITWAWCDTGDGIPRQFDISKLTIVSRNTVVEPEEVLVADVDYGEDIEHGFEINSRVLTVSDPPELGTVTEIEGNRIWVTFDDKRLGVNAYNSEFLMSATDDKADEPVARIDSDQEIDQDYNDPYFPETHQDTASIVSVENPGLSKILSALSTYFHLHEELDVDIEWSLDDLMISRGQLEHELDTENNLDKYINDMAAISKNLRLYLEQIAGVIDNWCIELEQIAADYVEGGNDAES